MVTQRVGLSGPRALNVLGFGSLIAGYDVEQDFFALIQCLVSLSDNRCVMHKDILPGLLCDEPETFFIVPPFDFAAGHTCTPESSEGQHRTVTEHNWRTVCVQNYFRNCVRLKFLPGSINFYDEQVKILF